jgi:acyl carrier protein
MTPEQARAHVATVFRQIAPEVDLASLEPDMDLREQVDVDSMDFLNALIALEERTGIAIPEEDYELVDTLTKLTKYLVERDPSVAR